MGINSTSISVVMPALNEETAIESAVTSTLACFEKLGLDGEVVMVNDGSTDRTSAIADRLAAENQGKVFAVHHASPMGVGRSFLDGVSHSHKENVTMLPGDNENDPEQILRYAPLISQVDIVNPYVVNKKVRTRFRNALSSTFTFIINATFGTSFKYTNGTVIYRKSVLEKLKVRSGGFFFQAEALVKASRMGFLIAEVPYFLSERKGGVSKAVSFGSLKKVIKGYVALLWEIYIGRATPGN